MDVLEELPLESVRKLRDFYKQHEDALPNIYAFFNTAFKWLEQCPDKKYFTFCAPNGDWSDGTFVALMHFSCGDVLLHTFEKSCKRLKQAIKSTNRISYKKPVIYYCVHDSVRHAVREALEENGIVIEHETLTSAYCMRREEAIKIEINLPKSNEYFIDILKPEHAEIVNAVWPHRYDDSVEYLRTFIQMNGGHGVFRNSDGKLVSWVLKNYMGMLGILQTDDAFKRMGFGTAVTKSLSKEIAMEGHHPFGTVLLGNKASEQMFNTLEFKVLSICSYIVTEVQ